MVQDITIVGAKPLIIGTNQTMGGFCVSEKGLGYW